MQKFIAENVTPLIKKRTTLARIERLQQIRNHFIQIYPEETNFPDFLRNGSRRIENEVPIIPFANEIIEKCTEYGLPRPIYQECRNPNEYYIYLDELYHMSDRALCLKCMSNLDPVDLEYVCNLEGNDNDPNIYQNCQNCGLHTLIKEIR